MDFNYDFVCNRHGAYKGLNMYGPPWDGVSWADLSFNMFEISFATDNALVLINEDALRRPRLIRGCRVNPIGAEPAQLTIGFPPQ